jgi:hypothetical protein
MHRLAICAASGGSGAVVLAVLGFVAVFSVIGLGYLALILGRSFRLHFTLRSIKVEIDQPGKAELPPPTEADRK